jgi:hypothetical protein
LLSKVLCSPTAKMSFNHLARTRTGVDQGQILLERLQIKDVNLGEVAPFRNSSQPFAKNILHLEMETIY